MKKTLTTAAVLLALTGLALAQCPMQGPGAQGGPAGGPMMEGRGGRMMSDDAPRGLGMGRGQWWENAEIAKELGLTNEQSEKIDQMALKHRKEMVKLQADLKIARMELQDLIEDNASDSDIRKKSNEIKLLGNKEHEARTEHMLDVRKVLTAEQQKKLKSLNRNMRRHMMINQDGCQGYDKK
jgi:Spy/CpxP family protein refolding chaperone